MTWHLSTSAAVLCLPSPMPGMSPCVFQWPTSGFTNMGRSFGGRAAPTPKTESSAMLHRGHWRPRDAGGESRHPVLEQRPSKAT